MLKSACFVLFVALFSSSFALAVPTETSWTIQKTEWSATDERNYSDFIQKLGEAPCYSLESCLKSSANPYRATDPAHLGLFADCAKLPYLLRAYFAWKNHLPFSIESDVEGINGGGDLRYTPLGNRVTDRTDFVARANGSFPNGIKAINFIGETVNSSFLRVDPEREDGARRFSDFYSPAITRNGIRPGTTIYDPNGHAAVVYKVTNDGRVLFMDAHPDNSLTHGTFNPNFVRSNPGQGAGFKNWRPLRLMGAQPDGEGHFLGGRIIGAQNSDIPDFSVEEIYGNVPAPDHEWTHGSFVYNGQKMNYFDFVRSSLASDPLVYDPLKELQTGLRGLCTEFQDRVKSVDAAVKAGLSTQNHPDQLPDNIFGADGDWEEYATPARDAELKTVLSGLHDEVVKLLGMGAAHDPALGYSGTDLRGDLFAVYQRETRACQVSFRASNGSTQSLNLDQLIEGIYQLSFDPYNCTELRWGETRMASCRDDATKRGWYQAEQYIRNIVGRPTDLHTGVPLSDLQDENARHAGEKAPELSIRALLQASSQHLD